MSGADTAGCSPRSSSGTFDCAASSSSSLTSSRALGRSSTRQAWSTAASSSEGASSTRCPRAATPTSCAASSRALRTIRRLPSSRTVVARWRPVRVSSSWSDTSPRIPTRRSRFFSLTWRCSSTSGGGSARRTSMGRSWRAAVSDSPRPSLWGALKRRWGITSSRRSRSDINAPRRRRATLPRRGSRGKDPLAAPRTQPRDREREDDGLSLGRGGAGRRAVPDRVRAAQDVRRVSPERTPVAVRNRLEPVAEAPAWRGPAAARQRADGDGSGGGGRARERPGARRARAVLARGRRDRGAAGRRARGAPALRVGGTLVPERGRGSRAADRHGTLAAQPRSRAPARTDQADRENQGEVAMKPVDLARKLRREAALEPAALDRGKAVLMAAIRQAVEPRRRPTIVPQLPYEDIGAALSFLERAFGFREIPASRMVSEAGVLLHALVEFGDGVIGIGGQGAHGAISPKSAGIESQYISVYVADVDAHYQRAVAAGARIASGLRDHFGGVRAYEALDLEGHRWRFRQRMREVPSTT